jgi:hypothetical protein
MGARSSSPEKGIRALRDVNPRSGLHGDNKYCHNGGTTFAPSYRARRRPAPLRGSMIGTFGPLYGTLRSC